MGRESRYSPEVRQRAVRMVAERLTEYESEWAPVSSIADSLSARRRAKP